MPTLSKQTLAFPEDGRVHLAKVYKTQAEIEKDASHLVDNRADFQREEQEHNALFLRTLSRMLARDGHKANAEQMYPLPYHAAMQHPYGSRPHVVLGDFSDTRPGDFSHIPPNETTTDYSARYIFMSPPALKNGFEADTPLFVWDARVIHMLTDHGVATESVKEFGKDFLRLADLSDHDYLHHVIDPRRILKSGSGFMRFLDPGEHGPAERKKHKSTGSSIEDHAMALQALILKEMFRESPRRKEKVLSWAAEGYTHLHEMQETALKNCSNDREKEQVNEAVTYLAEVMVSRLFRIVSPADPDLRMTTATGRSVAEAMDTVKLVSPDYLRERNHGVLPEDNLGLLERHCEAIFKGSLYHAIHNPETFPMYTKTGMFFMGFKEADPVEVVARANKLASAHERDPKAYVKETQARVRDMRMAEKLREKGDTMQAHLIEAKIRGHLRAPSADKDETPGR